MEICGRLNAFCCQTCAASDVVIGESYMDEGKKTCKTTATTLLHIVGELP